MCHFSKHFMVSENAECFISTVSTIDFYSCYSCSFLLLHSSVCMGCALFAMGLEEGNLQPYDRSFMENLWPRYEPDPYTGVSSYISFYHNCCTLIWYSDIFNLTICTGNAQLLLLPGASLSMCYRNAGRNVKEFAVEKSFT